MFTPPTHRFEFRIFPADEYGRMLEGRETIEFHDLVDVTAAKRKTGSLAKANNGPIDLAWAGDAPWNDRYITTASPSEFHQSGYRFERLD